MRLTRLLLLLMPLLAAVGCGHAPHARLRAIDGIIESSPDSAMALLGAIDRAGFSAADSAYYALLYTQAQIKTNVYLTSDSLISRALDAYRFSSDPDLRKRAHFYAAKVAYRCDDYKNAMKNATIAHDISIETNSDYWRAKSAELISDILSQIYNYPEGFKFEKEAIEYYEKTGKIDNHRYALCDLCTYHIFYSDAERAAEISDSIRNVASHSVPRNNALEHYALNMEIPALIDLHEYDKVQDLLREYYNYDASEREILDMTINECLIPNGENTTTKLLDAYNLAANERDSVRIIYAEYQLAMNGKDFRSAAKLADTLLEMQSSIAFNILTESVMSTQRDYYIDKAFNKQQESRQYKLAAILLSIIFIIILIAVIGIFRYRMRAKKSELAIKIAALVSEQKTAEQNEKKLEEANSILLNRNKSYENTISHLFKEQWATLNMLCNQLFELDSPGISNEVLLNSIKREVEKLKSHKNLAVIEESVNQYTDNIITTLRQECDSFKESDYVFITLCIAGFSPRAVCLFTDIKYKQFYQKKRRLKERIEKSDADHKEQILAFLR